MHPTEKNQIVIDEQVAPIVRRMFAMAAEGISCRQIASTFNEEQIPTPATYAGLTLSHHGLYSGKWSSERVSFMLQNETYVGNMVQGRQVKVSYKSKKCLHQTPDNWIVVEGTHEPLVSQEIFDQVQLMIRSRTKTRSRTYDFLLKGLIYCHECGYPLAVLNRKNAAGEERLIFVCRTYQRFTKAGVCTCHCIKEQTVTEAVVTKVQEVCQQYLNPAHLCSIAHTAVEDTAKKESCEDEILQLEKRQQSLTANLDQMYMDRLNGLLAEEDFQRIYDRVRSERKMLEEQIKVLQHQQKNPVRAEEKAREIVQRFMDSAFTSRELLVSLIERVELTEDKRIIIKFRFRELEAIS